MIILNHSLKHAVLPAGYRMQCVVYERLRARYSRHADWADELWLLICDVLRRSGRRPAAEELEEWVSDWHAVIRNGNVCLCSWFKEKLPSYWNGPRLMPEQSLWLKDLRLGTRSQYSHYIRSDLLNIILFVHPKDCF